MKGRGRADEKEGRRLMSAKAYVGPVINLRKRASYLESCATPLFIFSKFLRLTGLSAFRYRSPSCAKRRLQGAPLPFKKGTNFEHRLLLQVTPDYFPNKNAAPGKSNDGRPLMRKKEGGEGREEGEGRKKADCSKCMS